MSTPLSEKAKGKQRAVDPPAAGQGPSNTNPVSRDLTIRFTEGGSDLIVHVGERDTVKDVKQKVFGTPGALERKANKALRSDQRFPTRTTETTPAAHTLRSTTHGRDFHLLLAHLARG
jgi:hypothetical protein